MGTRCEPERLCEKLPQRQLRTSYKRRAVGLWMGMAPRSFAVSSLNIFFLKLILFICFVCVLYFHKERAEFSTPSV